jgi:hypothetical protein
MIINGNKLYNIPTAIYHSSSTGSLGYILGRTRIINNLVRPELESPVLTSGSESVLQGIEVVSSVSSVSGAVKDNILIQGNNLQRVFNGVKFSNCTQQRVLNMTNNISLQYQSPTALQYGIYAANNYNALCYGNQVSGIGAVASDDRKRAFYNASNRLNTLDCNHAIHTGRGFDFDGIQPQTYWKGNSMEDHRMGMALGGPIDQQGKPDYAILNQWNGTWSSPTYNQTLCYAYTNPTLSRLFVKNNLIENPTANFDNPTYKRYDATSLITTLHAYDDPCATSSSYTPIPIGKLSTAPLIHFIKSGNVDYGSNNDINAWMGQMSLYRFIHEDDSFHYQSNNAFVSFAAMADNARFGWLSHIEDALASGNTSLAQSLLNQPVAAKGNIFVDSTLMLTDTSAADTIVAHYVQFYNQYLSYLLSGNTDSTVLASLAYLCPRLHGAVVYQARAFYTQRYGINTVYNDDSLCMSAPSRIAYPDAPIASQDYTLYPNPNNGTFVLKQKTNADKKVLLKVYNALGVIVYQSEISFINGQINVGMGQKTPGVYLICIGDEMAKTVCLRFIIH